MDDKSRGFVYILTNKSFRDDWVKIGNSGNEVNVRSKQLYNTAVPLPYDIYATLEVDNYKKVEDFIHKQLDLLTDTRVNEKREFFNINPQIATQLFLNYASITDNAIVRKYEGNNPVQIYPVEKQANKQPRLDDFRFSMIGLKKGDSIIFDVLKLPVMVASDNEIIYKGVNFSLTGFCLAYHPQAIEKNRTHFRGPAFFSYNGKKLTVLRKEFAALNKK